MLISTLELACELNIIKCNPYNNIKINRRLCRHIIKKENTTQIFFDNEIKLLYKALDEELAENPDCAPCLAIRFMFQTGVRVSEVVGVKFSDIANGDIHIQRMEAKCSSYNTSDSSFSKAKYQIVEHTKTKNDAGCKYIPLTPIALDIIEHAKCINEEYGNANSDFIFCTREGRITVASRLCETLNIDSIRKFLGHTNDSTTYGYIHNDITTRKLYNDALNQ